MGLGVLLRALSSLALKTARVETACLLLATTSSAGFPGANKTVWGFLFLSDPLQKKRTHAQKDTSIKMSKPGADISCPA